MKIPLWVRLAITYIILISMAALLAYLTGYRLLQMPLTDVYIVIGLTIFAITVGMIIGVKILLARGRKKQ